MSFIRGWGPFRLAVVEAMVENDQVRGKKDGGSRSRKGVVQCLAYYTPKARLPAAYWRRRSSTDERVGGRGRGGEKNDKVREKDGGSKMAAE